MGFLNQKEDVLDIILTAKGRELLAKNQLNFSYYAFSDEGIDYSGSLAASSSSGLTFDDYVRRNLSFEGERRGQSRPAGSGGYVNEVSRTRHRDLQSFLYTIPANQKTLPTFEVNVNTGSVLNLERRFEIVKTVIGTKPVTRVQDPIDVVVRATVPKSTYDDRVKEYVLHQRFKEALYIMMTDFVD